MYYVDEDMWELYAGIGMLFCSRVARFAIVLEACLCLDLPECVCNTTYLYIISLYRGTSRDDYRSLSLLFLEMQL